MKPQEDAVSSLYTTGTDLFKEWIIGVEQRKLLTWFELSPPFDALDIRPGRLILFGGPPGSGKTAALLQISVDLLRLNKSLRLLMANVEMAPSLLMDRIASCLSSVPLSVVTNRTLTDVQLTRVRAAIKSLDPVGNRVAFLHPPFDLKHVADAGDEFKANVFVLDYIQRFSVGEGKGDKREQLETAATVLRRFCDAGAIVLVASAVARQRHAGRSTYSGLNLASFRGSSELEYGADAAYLLVREDNEGVTLQCEKNRYGELKNIEMRFDPTIQMFTKYPSGLARLDSMPKTK